MLGWFVGRVLARNTSQDIAVARTAMSLMEQREVAWYLVRAMSFVEAAREQRDRNGLIAASRSLLREAQADRHSALAAGANSKADPSWLAAALCENWAGALLATTERRISARAFDRVDRTIWEFVSEVLPPGQIAAAAGLAH
jgi:hypothetical protein